MPRASRGNGEGTIYFDSSKRRYYAAVAVERDPISQRATKRVKVSGKTREDVAQDLRTKCQALAAKPIFVIVNPKNGRYRKLSFTIPSRPKCSFVDFPITDGGYNYVSSYDADEGHIYITRQDLCGRFISTFPWR